MSPLVSDLETAASLIKTTLATLNGTCDPLPPGSKPWPTPGELFYKTYQKSTKLRLPMAHLVDWEDVVDISKQCWEEAAFVLLTEKEKYMRQADCSLNQ